MSAAAYPVRPIAPHEFAAAFAVDHTAFNSVYPIDRERAAFQRVYEPDRSLAAFDGDRPVGMALALSFQLTVPGAVRPAAGVTGVSVLPSHRRRGVLHSLMRRQLADIHQAGQEAVAVLWASESVIYPRYGYGHAAPRLNLTLGRADRAFVPAAPLDPDLRIRVGHPDEVRAELAKLFDAVRTGRPGMFARSEGWWDYVLDDADYRRSGATELSYALVEDGGGPRGYALLRARPGWDEDGVSAGHLQVHELFATDPAAYAAVWAHVLDRDLVATVSAGLRPPDDPLLRLLADPRRARPRVIDGLWARLVDVGRALAERAYAAPVDVVIEVDDPVCPWNAGRWRLSAGTEGASCARTTAAADLVLPVHVLGAGYLGAPGLSSYAGAGLVREVRPGALARLATALSWDPQPCCPVIF